MCASPVSPPPDDAKKTGRGRTRASIGAVRNPETTEAILQAAEQILDENGYHAFSLDAVVRRAGSSKPTIYRWWSNKGELLRDVYERAGEAALTLPDTGSLFGDLSEHLHSLRSWWKSSRSGEALRSFITEIQLKPDTIHTFRRDFLARRSRILVLLMQRAVARGEIPASARIDAAVELLVGISWLHLLTNDLDSKETVDAAVRIVVDGLRT